MFLVLLHIIEHYVIPKQDRIIKNFCKTLIMRVLQKCTKPILLIIFAVSIEYVWLSHNASTPKKTGTHLSVCRTSLLILQVLNWKEY